MPYIPIPEGRGLTALYDKITQKELAAQVGVTPTTLSKYENGEWIINQAVIDRIRELYGVEIRPLKSRKKTWQLTRRYTR